MALLRSASFSFAFYKASYNTLLDFLLSVTYLFFFCVKCVILTGERLHRYKQIAHVCFELAPLEARVEQFQDEGFDLNLVQVGEHLAQQRLDQLHGEVFVGGEGVSLFVRIEDWLFDEALRSVH